VGDFVEIGALAGTVRTEITCAGSREVVTLDRIANTSFPNSEFLETQGGETGAMRQPHNRADPAGGGAYEIGLPATVREGADPGLQGYGGFLVSHHPRCNFKGFFVNSFPGFQPAGVDLPADAAKYAKSCSGAQFQKSRPALLEHQITNSPSQRDCIYGPESLQLSLPSELMRCSARAGLQPQRKPPPSLTEARLLSNDCRANMLSSNREIRPD